jgi:putative drug exporter of the RND superfamily
VLVTSHPWAVIGGWIAAIAVVLALSPQLVSFTSNNNSNFLPSSYESVQALAVTSKYFPTAAGATGTMVVYRADGKELTSDNVKQIETLASQLNSAHIPSVTSVTTSTAYVSTNKKVQLVQIVFAGEVGASGPNAAVPKVRSQATTDLKGTGLVSGLTGNAAINVDSTNAYDKAEKIITIATVLLILVLLGLVFRSAIISILPIIVIGAVHQAAQSFTADLANWFGFEVGSSLAPLLVVVMFGVGTDYIVFLLFRYRENLTLGSEPLQALQDAAASIGVVIASAAATVMAAFAALLFASLESLRTLAPGLIVGVLFMLLAALTLVPAIFSLLGRHLFWPSMPKARAPGTTTISQRLGKRVARHPAIILLAFSVLLIGLAFGSLGYKVTYNQLAELPSSTPSQQAFNVMASAFPPGLLGPTQVMVSSSSKLTPQDLTTLESRAKASKGVATVLSPQIATSGNAAMVQVLLSSDPYSNTAMNNVQNSLRPNVHGTVPGATVLVGGTTSQLVDVRAALDHDQKLVFPIALGIIFVILALLLQSVVAPLYLLIGVAITYVATIGVSVLVFLKGFGWAGLDFSLLIVVYLFVMAIGTDYNILISHRMREEFDAGADSRTASAKAITEGAPAVMSAGLILAGSFASLLLTGIQNLQEYGLGVALGVLLASYILATRIVPTIGALRGWRFWWPHSRDRRQRDQQRHVVVVSTSEPEAQPVRAARAVGQEVKPS